MKGLLAKSGVAVVGLSLAAVVVQSAPQGVTASGRAPSAAVVAQARSNFVKTMSSHSTMVQKGGWVSPGVKHSTSVKTKAGTVSSMPSVNWSGFADSDTTAGQTVTSVSGDWTIPAVKCLPRPYQNQDAFLANWVGIDGLTNGTVEQLGTATQCFEGVEYYYVWYEMYPAGTVEEGTTACINNNVNCPQPGDRVSASVTVTPGSGGNNNYVLKLTDHTRPQESFSVSQGCAAATCLDSSAEWIIERPAVEPAFGVQILPLADFTSTGFTRGNLVAGGTSSSIQGFNGGPVYNISMNDDTGSYYLDCVGQTQRPGTLLQVTPNQCPVVAPHGDGRFYALWDSSF
jgi:Peptidase A4 family